MRTAELVNIVSPTLAVHLISCVPMLNELLPSIVSILVVVDASVVVMTQLPSPHNVLIISLLSSTAHLISILASSYKKEQVSKAHGVFRCHSFVTHIFCYPKHYNKDRLVRDKNKTVKRQICL